MDHKNAFASLPPRAQLAAAYRLCDLWGFNEGVCNHLTLEVDGAAARRAARGWKPTMLAERAGRLAARGAALLLCTCRLSEAAIAALDASGVAAVMLVEPDEARRVATALGADVMPDALPSTLEGAALGAATELTPIALGGRSAVCVAPAEPAEPAKIAHVRAVTLVVAAPSAAMSGVYARAVRRTLRVVAQACCDDGTMALAGGGGAAEMALAAAVRAQAAPCEPPARAAARRVIAAAAEAVPRALLASGGDRRAVAVGLAALRAAHDGAVSGTVGSTVRMGVAVGAASSPLLAARAPVGNAQVLSVFYDRGVPAQCSADRRLKQSFKKHRDTEGGTIDPRVHVSKFYIQ